ncbi:hypothetical protein KEM54_004489 [Ascosphaera aggregata]|nr:hypothetical protein KEM54_004489 [Ascosphaera aggregata]
MPCNTTELWVTTKLSLGTAANRDKAFNLYSKCARHAWYREPGVLKYFIALPRAFEDDTSLYVFQDLETHFNSPGEIRISTFLNSDPVILTPIIDTLTPRASFTRTNDLSDDPTIVYASIAYQTPEAREQALHGWMDVTHATFKNEMGTLSYNILDDQDDHSSVKILEIHESEEWLFEVHAKSEAVVRNKSKFGTIGYVPTGEYKTIHGLKTYVTGPSDATDAILLIYDIFGFYPQTIQGADILSNSDPAHKYRVFIPDFFQGEPAELAWFPPDNDDKKAKLGEFFKTKATPSEHTSKIPGILAEANKLAPEEGGFKSWGVLGFCWGGKITTLLSGKDTPFKCAIQAHPAMLDAEDAKNITIPFATLASKDEDAATVKAFDENLKVAKFTETYPDQIHGWMAARSNLSDERVRKEYERGYKTALVFFHQYM